MRRPKPFSPAWVFFIIIGAVVAPFVFRTQADPDLWGHVRFGLDILTTHSFSRVDPYSFTQDIPWVNHEWLSELLMGGAYRLGGNAGLALLKGALVLLTFFVVLGAYLEASPVALGFAFLILVVGSGRVTASVRPQLWSLLAVAILCRLLIAGPRRWWLMVLPLLFALWVNLHGGWIVGAAILALWTFGSLWRARSDWGFAAAVAALSALSTLINPYGWRMWQFLGETVRMSRPIVEWQPLLTTPPTAWLPWFAVAIGAGLTVFSKNRPPLDRLATIALLGAASFRVERLSPFFAVVSLILLSETVRDRWPLTASSLIGMPRRSAGTLAAACAAVVLMSAAITARAAQCIPITGDWIPDRLAGRALVEARPSGRLVTWFDWGEYAIWHLSPSARVSLDGRRETVYSDAVLRNHDEMNAASPAGLTYLETLDPDYVWLPSSLTVLKDWLDEHGYRIDISTDRSFVAVRDDQPVVRLSDAPLASCFPGP